MSKTYDVVVIGAGHNGLAAAVTLAKAGKSVCVVEKSDRIGGMAANATLGEGVEVPQIAHLLYNLNPKIAGELGLAQLTQSPALPTVSLAPDGRHVVMRADKVSFADGTPHPDADAYGTLYNRMVSYAGLLAQMSSKSPPKLAGSLTDLDTLKELAGLAKLGLGLKRMGKREMREFLRILLSNAFDLVLDEMPDGPLAGALCADAVRGNFLGPRSPGTVFTLMYRFGAGGAVRLPKGGIAAVSETLADTARKAGVDIRTGHGVSAILVDEDRACGVTLESGDRIDARAVMSSAGAARTMSLAGVEHFDTEAARRVKNLRCKGTVAKLNVVLDCAPEITGLSGELCAARLLVAPSATEVERSFNPAKYGEITDRPTIEAVIPTLTHPSPSGQHILSATIQHVPHTPNDGWNEESRARVIDSAMEALGAHMPGLNAKVEAIELLTPADIETRTGAAGGHWHHGEMGFDQILNVRPVNGAGHYAFNIPGLYLCGASAHPGGDVTGAPGRNGAKQLLKDGVI